VAEAAEAAEVALTAVEAAEVALTAVEAAMVDRRDAPEAE
jgi:hypothetical protein